MGALVRIGLVFGILVTALAGCTTGKNFTPPTQAMLTLGRTTEADIIRQFGKPDSTKTMVTPKATGGTKTPESSGSPFQFVVVEGTYRRLVFRFSDRTPTVIGNGVPDVKIATFLFWNDVLIDYDYISNISGASSDFDESKLAALVKGESIEAQAVSLLGPPAGMGIYPVIRDPGYKVLHYGYFEVTPPAFFQPGHVTNKNLQVLIDPNGRVVDYAFQTDTSQMGGR